MQYSPAKISTSQAISESPSANASGESKVHSNPIPLRILFVEDNDNVRELSICLLENDHREIIAVASGEAALDSFYKDPCDVVITDVSLPGMSGIELTKQLIKVAPELWVIIASGYQLPLGLEKLGPNVMAITKPFEAEQVEALIAKVVAARDAV